MKRFTLLYLLCIATSVFGQLTIKPSMLEVYLEERTYQSEQTLYSEVHLAFNGNTINYLTQPDSTIQGALEITIAYLQNDTVVTYNKSISQTPMVYTPSDFFVIKRTAIPATGKYTLKVLVQDLNNAENLFTATSEVYYTYQKAGISKPLLLASSKAAEASTELAKNGIILEALPNAFIGKDQAYLKAYLELYGLDQIFKEPCILSYMIVEETDLNATKPLLIQHKNINPSNFAPIILNMAVDQLPSGNYKFITKIRGRDLKEYFTEETTFQRSNPFYKLEEQLDTLSNPSDFLKDEFVAKLTEEELRFAILAIAPKVDRTDGDIISATLANPNRQAHELFLFNYWVSAYPINPQAAFEAYMDIAKAVDETFRSGFRMGIETDRAYIYLKYGRPNDVIKEYNEMDAFPYEIWFYEGLEIYGQTNVKFLFYNPSKASNDFLLLHSNCFGEVQNPRWEIELYKSVSATQAIGNDPLNSTQVEDNFGRNARRYFEN
jgi:GWxTD domain-containing protein